MNAHVRAREYAETCRPSRSSRHFLRTVRGFALRSARARGDVWVNRFPRPEGRVYAETHWLSVGVGAVCERHAQKGAPSQVPVGVDPRNGFVQVLPYVLALQVSSSSLSASSVTCQR